MPFLHRIVAACLIGVSGASVLIASGMASPDTLNAASFGAFIAGALFAPLFGHDGAHGYCVVALGALGATITGATIAGLILVFSGAELMMMVAAPVLVIGMILAVPQVLLAWVATMAFTHLALCFLRQRHPTPGKNGCP
jgi:hypothetical protein